MVRIGVHDCTIVRVMVLKTDAVGYIQRVEKAKVVVFSGGVDTSATETKGTMQIHSAEQLEKYSKTGAAKVEELIKAVAESGAKVVVSGGAVGEMALHFCERYKLMVLRISSKFELQRFCRTTGAVAILKLGRPNPNDLGYVDSVSVEEIGGVRVMGKHFLCPKIIIYTEAPALPASLKLYKEVQQLGFTIFLLTGRDESQRNITVKNLLYAGYSNWKRLIRRQESDLGKLAIVYKSERREALEDEGYTIHESFGDQWSHLSGFAIAA
ncbi:hypothetical protein RHMOL_Rhmol03G0009200 [Rhododendron molle]|uniref:Uncharacterized protein n=1 Tax=Rhododendron molle TaxID=49168 RepID=A0ACC0PAB8_RHOML|nr:hypothetical protein RHMOL_Rhmol03G0009200 [Rhododendron molle]